jgi:hypothetical protein
MPLQCCSVPALSPATGTFRGEAEPSRGNRTDNLNVLSPPLGPRCVGRGPKLQGQAETWPPLIRAPATPAATTSWGASRPRRNRRTGQAGSVSAPSTRVRSWVGSIPHPTEHPARPTYAALRRPWVDLFSGWSAPSLAAADRPGSAGPALRAAMRGRSDHG